ncbi:unnamed protein product [Didymodactylos carnosus]|uniref:Uncharacterized protein n=1 Tax=Didymodactylos carnosus TaxID=1234261 RepID=A0A815FSH2_9BILA|nr:unnamed protein product [Didymodactylos carnosus]CAF1330122.1 unnamed protein product [Didymodactylos carnosus]CAF3499117.1 unnamed protein product [Didymodactylos carnosus]CAF4182924.1 unnamed protein product [Didymodactylos carnosus]
MTHSTNGSKKRFLRRLSVYIIVALVLLIPAILFYIYWEKLIISRVLKAVKLIREPESEAMKNWKNPPTIITRAYRLYNYTTDVDEIKQNAWAMLHVQETRPYVYDIKVKKENIKWINNDQNLEYSVQRLFQRHKNFDETLLTEDGTFVNILRAIFRAQYGRSQDSGTFETFVGKDVSRDVFYKKLGIEELEGFTSELFEKMKDSMMGPNTDKYGFVYRYNGSRAYNFTIRVDNENKGRVLKYASEYVPFKINPTTYDFPVYDGLTFLPLLQTKKTLNMFQPDICRPIQIKFNKIVHMYNMDLHEFVIRFIDLTQCHNNSESCDELESIDISKCVSSSMPEDTIYLSKPHFYGHNSSKFNIHGFAPEKEKHDSMLYFEPYTGTPVKAHHRIQMNVNPYIDTYKQNRDGEWERKTKGKSVKRMLPLLWMDQEVTLYTEVLQKLQHIHRMVNILKIVRIVAVLLAITILVMVIVLMEVIARKKQNHSRYKPK